MLSTRDNDQAFVLRSTTSVLGCTRFHNLDSALTRSSNLVDLTSTLPDNTPNQVVRNVYLLFLQLQLLRMRRRRVRVSHVRRRRASRCIRLVTRMMTAVRFVGRVGHRRRGIPFIRLDKDIANIVSSNVNCVGNTCDAENTLRKTFVRMISKNHAYRRLPQLSPVAYPRSRSILLR